FSLVCGLCVALGVYTLFTFHSLAEKSKEISDDDFPSVVQLTSMRAALHLIRESDFQLLLCQTPACLTAGSTRRQAAVATFQEASKAYEPFVTSDQERGLSQAIYADFAKYLEIGNRAETLLTTGKTGDA